MKMSQRLMIPIVVLSVALILIGSLSVIQIVNLSKLSDQVSIVDDILRMRNDHVTWVMDLRDSIDKGEQFTGQSDPTQCRFGLWMYSEDTRQNYDDTVQSYLEDIEPYHNTLHESVGTINAFIESGETEKARQYYYETVDPTLASITEILGRLEQRFDQISSEAHDKLKSTEQSSIVL